MTSVLYFLSFSVKYLLTVKARQKLLKTLLESSPESLILSFFPTKSIAPIAIC